MVILYIQEYLCVLTKLFMGTRVSEDFQFRVAGFRHTYVTENAQPYLQTQNGPRHVHVQHVAVHKIVLIVFM